MSPNLITLLRLLLAFLCIALFHAGAIAGVAALVLLFVVIALDGVDGYVARRQGSTTEVGAAFDIAADRIVESVFWIFFAAEGLISFWIPVIVIARGGITDFLRSIAFAKGQTAFGEKTMMQSRWGRLLVGSRASRAAYGIVKCAAFLSLGGWLLLRQTHIDLSTLRIGALGLAVITVVFCLVRGVPVMVEGARFFSVKV
jgi:CDP-diacylglycerol--glycerol-3-phosphate 3-phosphatidyltransferase